MPLLRQKVQEVTFMKVKLYTLPTCGICHMIKTKLEDRHIDFEEADFNEVAESMGLERAPLLEVNNNNEKLFFMSPSKMVEWINQQ